MSRPRPVLLPEATVAADHPLAQTEPGLALLRQAQRYWRAGIDSGVVDAATQHLAATEHDGALALISETDLAVVFDRTRTTDRLLEQLRGFAFWLVLSATADRHPRLAARAARADVELLHRGAA